MIKINHINLGGNSYDIIIGQDILQSVGEKINAVYKGTRIALVTDETVRALYGDIVIMSLQTAGFNVELFTLKAGEETKSIESFSYLLSEFAKIGLSRKDLVVGLGGGVIGDLSGFTASCYMRGLPHIQIPTTLLSQVDSSVGGKTAINLVEGKNLAGTFWQPKMVLIDTNVLKTLDDRQFSSGMAEVIKYGAIFSKDFFLFLKNHNTREKVMKVMDYVVFTCCEFKKSVVEKDEKDTGERMLLNFGHTFAHGIEKKGQYTQYTHGEAVALGMCIAAYVGQLLKVTASSADTEIKNLCNDFSLPVNDIFKLNTLTRYVKVDKKSGDGSISLILLEEIGEAIIKPISMEDFASLMNKGKHYGIN